mmetsp:Transcript_39457/g.89722  ORF Transcript_39457/g.89722 Transcript_39457/m.89722 type:complete len:223 (-) Transcript_39457:335-1003(-)
MPLVLFSTLPPMMSENSMKDFANRLRLVLAPSAHLGSNCMKYPQQKPIGAAKTCSSSMSLIWKMIRLKYRLSRMMVALRSTGERPKAHESGISVPENTTVRSPASSGCKRSSANLSNLSTPCATAHTVFGFGCSVLPFLHWVGFTGWQPANLMLFLASVAESNVSLGISHAVGGTTCQSKRLKRAECPGSHESTGVNGKSLKGTCQVASCIQTKKLSLLSGA